MLFLDCVYTRGRNFERKQGWIVDCVITEDKTAYKQKPGDEATNLYAQLAIKLEGAMVRPSVNAGDAIEVEGEPVCTVYGDYKDKAVTVPDLPRHYDRWQRREVSKAALARELGISRPTLDRLFSDYDNR